MTRRTYPPVAVMGGALAILLSALLLSGCANQVAGGAVGEGEAACNQAFAQAIAVDPASDTVGGLDGTIASCSSLEAWVAAAQRYPDTTAGQDPVAYAGTRCAATPGIASSPVCVAVPVQATPTSGAAQ
ncbi:MAG: hypothetical protein QOH61_2650 [Chloroflexota bacterium]|nr:hypothetical protein [Chloroflexota bacterium]